MTGDDFDDDLIDDDILEETSGETEEPGVGDRLNQMAESVTKDVRELSERARAVEWLKLTLAMLHGIVLLPLLVLSPVVRVVPATWKLYHKLNKWSAWQMQRAAGADALANVRRSNDKEDLLPAAMVESSGTDEERSGWKIKGISDKRYDPGVRGGASSRYGKADMIHVNEDDPEQGMWVEASMDAAIALDRERYLFRDAEVTEREFVRAHDPQLGPTAVADGGVDLSEMFDDDSIRTEVVGRELSVTKPGIHEDTLVPLNSRNGYDGQLVSWNSYQNLKTQQADQEMIRNAKDSGRMAAMLEELSKADLFKWALILGAAGLILLFHQDIGAAISSFGGGGGGGNVAPSAGLGFLPLLKRRFGGE